MSIADSGRLP
jgi:hypothetical protein